MSKGLSRKNITGTLRTELFIEQEVIVSLAIRLSITLLSPSSPLDVSMDKAGAVLM